MDFLFSTDKILDNFLKAMPATAEGCVPPQTAGIREVFSFFYLPKKLFI